MFWTNGGRMLLKLILGEVTSALTFPRCSSPISHGASYGPEDPEPWLKELPADVKEGHFVVRAMNDGQPKRFIIELYYLADPGFLRLLELAEEEYGFNQVGVLTVLCRSDELLRILKDGERSM